MSSFTGVSIITNGKNCTTTTVDTGMDSGYHLLVVKDYSRTVQEIPNGKGIGAGPFMVGGHQWCISYCPNGYNKSSTNFISVFLCRVDFDTEEAVKVHTKFSFVDQVEYQKPMYIRATEPRSFSIETCAWGSRNFMKKDVLERSAHLKEDCFTIRCDIMVCNYLNPQQDAVDTLSDIGHHFKILLQDKLGSDVTFEVGSEMFPAHRCVLASRSKVFKAQLFGPMAEGITSSVIQIKDMEPKVFAALLSFIYTDSFPKMDKDSNMQETEGQYEEEEGQDGEEEGQDVEEEGQDEEEEGQDEEEAVEEIPEVEEEGQEYEAAEPVTWLQWLQDLFVAADRYDIQQLKFLCEKKLSEHIGVISVASTLALAEQHNSHRLKEACLKFVQVQSPKCLDKVMETDGWELIRTTYPSVLKELFAKVASNQKDRKRKR